MRGAPVLLLALLLLPPAFAQDAGGTLRGVVTDGHGAPIRGVNVTVTKAGHLLGLLVTDAQGAYAYHGAAGTYDVGTTDHESPDEASAYSTVDGAPERFAPVASACGGAPCLALSPGGTTWRNLTLERVGTLAGNVTLADGTPAQGSIRVGNRSRDVPLVDGSFRVSAAPGDRDVVATVRVAGTVLQLVDACMPGDATRCATIRSAQTTWKDVRVPKLALVRVKGAMAEELFGDGVEATWVDVNWTGTAWLPPGDYAYATNAGAGPGCVEACLHVGPDGADLSVPSFQFGTLGMGVAPRGSPGMTFPLGPAHAQGQPPDSGQYLAGAWRFVALVPGDDVAAMLPEPGCGAGCLDVAGFSSNFSVWEPTKRATLAAATQAPLLSGGLTPGEFALDLDGAPALLVVSPRGGLPPALAVSLDGRAMQPAERGLDVALFRAANGTVAPGAHVWTVVDPFVSPANVDVPLRVARGRPGGRPGAPGTLRGPASWARSRRRSSRRSGRAGDDPGVRPSTFLEA